MIGNKIYNENIDKSIFEEDNFFNKLKIPSLYKYDWNQTISKRPYSYCKITKESYNQSGRIEEMYKYYITILFPLSMVTENNDNIYVEFNSSINADEKNMCIFKNSDILVKYQKRSGFLWLGKKILYIDKLKIKKIDLIENLKKKYQI